VNITINGTVANERNKKSENAIKERNVLHNSKAHRSFYKWKSQDQSNKSTRKFDDGGLRLKNRENYRCGVESVTCYFWNCCKGFWCQRKGWRTKCHRLLDDGERCDSTNSRCKSNICTVKDRRFRTCGPKLLNDGERCDSTNTRCKSNICTVKDISGSHFPTCGLGDEGEACHGNVVNCKSGLICFKGQCSKNAGVGTKKGFSLGDIRRGVAGFGRFHRIC